MAFTSLGPPYFEIGCLSTLPPIVLQQVQIAACRSRLEGVVESFEGQELQADRSHARWGREIRGNDAEPNLLNNSKMTEETLRQSPVPVAFLRAGWFMENASWDVEAARNGVVPSFLQPLDHVIPMVATADIGRTAAAVLQEDWNGVRVVELEGPRRYSAADIGRAFAAALGREVRVESVPRETWEQLFRSQGMKNPLPRIRMVDGFNEGWIDFERAGEHRQGTVTLDTVIAGLIGKGDAA